MAIGAVLCDTMSRWLAGAVSTAALALLLVSPISSASLVPNEDRGGAASSPEERLEVSFGALEGLYERFERPTVRQFLRRLVQLYRQGKDPVIPGFTWVRTKRQVNIALESIEFGQCSSCALLITRGKNGAPHGRDAVIRSGAFMAGITAEGRLICAGPTDPEAHTCR